jgi:hypothetical protein
MTNERDPERLLDSWFAEGPLVVADRVIDDMAGRIARQPQRAAWRLRPWRFPTMSTSFRAVVLAGALLAAIVAGAVLTGGGRTPTPSRAPSASPSSVATSSPTASPPAPASAGPSGRPGASQTATSGAGPLSAGQHTSTQFIHPISFTVPEGWINNLDIRRTYALRPAHVVDVIGGAGPGVEVLGLVAIAEQTATRCDPVPKPGVGTSVDAIVGYVRAHPGLEAGTPVPITVDGHAGQQIDFQVSLSWGGTCPGLNPGDPVVQMVTDTGTPPGRAVGYGTQTRIRWNVIDVDGDTVIIECVTPRATFDDDVAVEQAIVDSIRFLPGS